jgi:hypothetical protein
VLAPIARRYRQQLPRNGTARGRIAKASALPTGSAEIAADPRPNQAGSTYHHHAFCKPSAINALDLSRADSAISFGIDACDGQSEDRVSAQEESDACHLLHIDQLSENWIFFGRGMSSPSRRGFTYCRCGNRRASSISGSGAIALATLDGAQRCGNSRSVSPSGKAIRSGASFAPVSRPRAMRGCSRRRACRSLVPTRKGTSARGTSPNRIARSKSGARRASRRFPAASAATNSRTRSEAPPGTAASA